MPKEMVGRALQSHQTSACTQVVKPDITLAGITGQDFIMALSGITSYNIRLFLLPSSFQFHLFFLGTHPSVSLYLPSLHCLLTHFISTLGHRCLESSLEHYSLPVQYVTVMSRCYLGHGLPA